VDFTKANYTDVLRMDVNADLLTPSHHRCRELEKAITSRLHDQDSVALLRIGDGELAPLVDLATPPSAEEQQPYRLP